MYLDIFDEIVDIMQNDYAGHLDKRNWDSPSKSHKLIYESHKKGQLNDYQFVNIVNDYLLDFQDPHVFFTSASENSESNKDIGFKVRRFKDALYVTEVLAEKNVNKGDKIISLDGLPILDLEEIYARELMGEPPERQKWEKIIERHKQVRIENTEKNYVDFDLKLYPKKQYIPIHKVDFLSENTVLMTLSDFFSSEPINEILTENKTALNKLDNLIIDVRKNRGGSDSSFNQLLFYLFPSGLSSINLNNYKMEFNVTDRVAEYQINMLSDMSEKTEDGSYKKTLNSMKQFFKTNSGKGLVPIDNGDSFNIEGTEYPKNIVILSDMYCGSAGDIFVDFASNSKKVTIIGRETAGLNDYSNLVKKDWHNKFTLYCPTSRMQYLDNNIKDNGVKPDIYIDWTPEHIFNDIDLETAIKFLK